MNRGFYINTAWNNIRKNYRFYVPQMLTGCGLLACFYIVYTLRIDERVRAIKGGEYIPFFMSIGAAVIGLLSIILIFYTNSFLMRQRKREYGLYNVLGMEKRHISRILFCETAISGMISIVGGVLFGMLFYKLCSLLICAMLKADIILGFGFVRISSLIPSVAFFMLLYLAAYIVNHIVISKMKPVELLKSRSEGEREPKVKWLVLLIGIVSLAGGYIISVKTADPLQALLLFFAAVFLVIIGTYCLFTAGSIFVLKRLRGNAVYYYTPKHMPSVSGLIYRMKQNAVGLASICILATGVLIMISTTVSLYSGMQDTLDTNYPQHLYLSCDWYSEDDIAHHVSGDVLTEIVVNNADQCGVQIEHTEIQRYLQVSYLFDGEAFVTNSDSAYDLSKLSNVIYISEDTYTELTGKTLDLCKNEIAIGVTATTIGSTQIPGKSVTLHGTSYSVKENINGFPIDTSMAMISPSCYGIVVADDEELERIYIAQKQDYAEYASEMTERVAAVYADREEASSAGEEIQEGIFSELDKYVRAQPGCNGAKEVQCQSYWSAKEAVIGMYGTLLFLGVILGLVCLFATVLIIYYKQISEGYEDRDRYQIMKKVGMSDKEIKQTVRSQMRSVFFLPVVFAGLHTAAAFPMLTKLLKLILLSSTKLFIICTGITFAVFTLVYMLIYSLTAGTYYKIVH